MINHGDTVLVALSGGADSVCLLLLLDALKEELGISLTALHVNHRIRGEEAWEDARFCGELCEEMKIPFYLYSINVPAIGESRGWNLEEAARKVRLALYKRAMKKSGAERCATAHHMNDQAETVLMNLIRGSGETGLAGIAPVVDGWLIRPMLDITREEIEDYLRAKNRDFREDSTNRDTNLLRNRVRLELIKTLREEYNPNILEALARTAGIQRESHDYTSDKTGEVNNKIKKRTGNAILLYTKELKKCHPHIRANILRMAYSELTGTGKRLTYDHIETIRCAPERAEGELSFSFPLNVEVLVNSEVIEFTLGKAELTRFERSASIPGLIDVPEIGRKWRVSKSSYAKFSMSNNLKDSLTGCFPADKFGEEVIIRSRKPGDRLRPLGMSGTKKLKDILIDKKIRRSLRSSLPVFVNNGEIFWVPGVVVSEAYRVKPDTDEIVVFTEEESG